MDRSHSPTPEELSELLSYLTPQETDEMDSLLATAPPTATALFRTLVGEPDPWQVELLESTARQIMALCSRQVGKTAATAVRVTHGLEYTDGYSGLIVSPSESQSVEMLRKVRLFRKMLGLHGDGEENKTSIELPNGNRIVAKPSNENTIVGFTATELILDEGARIADSMYKTVRPMLASTQGTLIALSTPKGKRGWFYDAWTGQGNWKRLMFDAYDCPRFTKEFLAEELEAMGPTEFNQEYRLSFDGGVGVLLPIELIRACEGDPLWPLQQGDDSRFPWAEPARGTRIGPLYVGVDLGRSAAAKAGRSVVWTWEKVGDMMLAREIFVMHGVEYEDQDKEIAKRLRRPTVVKVKIDKGSIGNQMSQSFEKRFPGKVEGVQLTDVKQGQIGPPMRTAFEMKRVVIPCDRDLQQDLQLVSKAVDQNGLPVIKTGKNETGHADRFWAAALALDAAQHHRVVVSGRPRWKGRN